MTLEQIQLAEINAQGALIKKAISIVEVLAKNKIADSDGLIDEDGPDVEKIKNLVLVSRELVSSRFWKQLKEHGD